MFSRWPASRRPRSCCLSVGSERAADLHHGYPATSSVPPLRRRRCRSSQGGNAPGHGAPHVSTCAHVMSDRFTSIRDVRLLANECCAPGCSKPLSGTVGPGARLPWAIDRILAHRSRSSRGHSLEMSPPRTRRCSETPRFLRSSTTVRRRAPSGTCGPTSPRSRRRGPRESPEIAQITNGMSAGTRSA